MTTRRLTGTTLATLAGLLAAAAGCSVDATRPMSAARAAAAPSVARFDETVAGETVAGETMAGEASIGAPQSWVVTIDPTVANSLTLDRSRLDLPASAICDPGTSGYGPELWDAPCAPATAPVTLTIVQRRTAAGDRLDFVPQLRFGPGAWVMLYMHQDHVTPASARRSVILYCADDAVSGCVDESLTDWTLRTWADRPAGLLFRRIKHFSGYLASI